MALKSWSFLRTALWWTPIFFPGGDIGKLSVCGTVNDIAVCGGVPRYLSCAFIIEEGFPLSSLEKIVASIGAAAQKAGVQVVTGDTKVVEKAGETEFTSIQPVSVF